MEVLKTKKKFTEIYERESNALFRYTYMRVHDREKAIDIVQDIFSELWKKYSENEEIEHERAFLFTLVRNRIIDWYRKKKSDSLDALMDTDSDTRPFDAVDEDAQSSIEIQSEAKLLLKVIETLDETYREVLYLRFTEDLSPQEIASILDTTANTISIRITRGLEKLREELHIKTNERE